MINEAERLIKQYGFSVFPVHGINASGQCTCGRESCIVPDSRGKVLAGKHPSTPNGFKNATTDMEAFTRLYKPFNNLAIATGPISNIFVLDVDGMEGESSLQSLTAANGPLPDTLTSYTGRGRHILFRYPDSKVFTRAGKVAPGLDVRGEGGYIVAPPSKHANGNQYNWIDADADIYDAPQWLLDMVTKRTIAAWPSFTPSMGGNEALSIDEIRELLSYLDADCSHDEWVNIGMAIHNEGYPISVWDEWSKRGTKYDPFIMTAKWRSFHVGGGITFGTLVHMAEMSGWKPSVNDVPIDMADHPARAFIERVLASDPTLHGSTAPMPRSPSETPLLFDPLQFPTVAGDIIRGIIETSQKPQPVLAMLNTFSVLGCIFGRRYASPMNTRTNLYTIGVADTGAAKDHSRRFLKDLMTRSGFGDYLGSDAVVSGPGILTGLQKRISQVMFLDEVGMMLKMIGDEKSSSALKVASKIITELYSSSGTSYIGGQYADTKVEQIRLINPNLNIYGTTTGTKYAEAVTKSSIQSGELNRFVVLEGDPLPKRRKYLGASTPHDALVEAVSAFMPAGLSASNSPSIAPEVITVSWNGLEDRIWDMGDGQDDKIRADRTTGALWARYTENVIKIAMIFAICRDPVVPRMIDMDLDIGEAVVSQSIHYMTAFANEYMHESQHEDDCNTIYRIIKANGRSISGGELYNLTRKMDRKRRNDALESLLDQGRISIDAAASNTAAAQRSTAGRKAVIYRVVK